MLEKGNSQCCGCMACVEICPAKAIYIRENQQGFSYPIVDEKKCILCGLCERVCDFTKYIHCQTDTEVSVFAVKRKKKRKYSQSGGAFSAIAEYFLKNGGIVYGVANINTNVLYYRVDNMKQIKLLRGSKYVQATVGDIFDKVIKDLQDEREVFFSGTPCQVAGLKRLLQEKKIERGKLYTCDLICHGVPSPRLYQEYLELVEKKYGKVKSINFRDKSVFGWHGHIVSFRANRKSILSHNYVNVFYSHLALRESCYECPYTSTKRVGDISIGDFWGIEKINPDFDDNKGISLVLINSAKGERLWDWCKNQFAYVESSIQDCLQPNLQHPTEKPEKYNDFWREYFNEGYEQTVKKYCDFNWGNDMHKYIFLFRKAMGKVKRRIITLHR